MGDTYFVEERSGVIGIGPITHLSPNMYPRRPKTNWRSALPWIRLLICLLACPLIIWNLSLLVDLITEYGKHYPLDANGEQIKPYTPFGFLVALSNILFNLVAGVFALTTEAACFSERLARFLYIIVYPSIAIIVFCTVVANTSMHIIWLVLLFVLLIALGFGLWQYIIISSIYLNEEGPVWFKPLLYWCLAAIPLLSASSACRDKKTFGCVPNDYIGSKELFVDYFSFTIMTTIAIISAIPFLFGSHQRS